MSRQAFGMVGTVPSVGIGLPESRTRLDVAPAGPPTAATAIRSARRAAWHSLRTAEKARLWFLDDEEETPGAPAATVTPLAAPAPVVHLPRPAARAVSGRAR